MPWHNTPAHLRKMCDTKGCENLSGFHGFGKDICWTCYNNWVSVTPAQIPDNQLEMFPGIELSKFPPSKIENPKFRKSA